MDKKRLSHIMSLLIGNGFFSFFMLFTYKMIASSFNIGIVIADLIEATKRNIGAAFIIFIVLMIISKPLSKGLEIVKEKTPWLFILLKTIYLILFTGLLAFVTSYYIQYFQLLLDPVATTEWLQANMGIYLLGTLLLFFLYLFAFTIIGNVYISSIITGIILTLLGYAHFQKLNLRVEPLYPSDFFQIAQLKDVIPMIREYISVGTILGLLVLIIISFFLIKFLPKVKLTVWTRVLLLVLSAFMVYSIAFFPKTFMKKIAESAKVSVVQWNQLDNYTVNGFIFGFVSNLQNDVMEKPKGYSKDRVLAIAKKYQNKNLDKTSSNSPNIIYIMNEAFWDPTKLPNVQFSEDPMPNIRKLMGDYTSGYNLSPAFGAATANVEFEALTGYSNYFLRLGSVPYQETVDKKVNIPSIVSELEASGYHSIAIHPYNGVFYKRNKVYQTLGFDQFLDMNSMKFTEKSGPFISDKSVSEEIFYRLKKQKEPIFIHTVTMQNHMSYGPGRYEANTVKVSGLTPESTDILETYTEGVKQADAALQHLVDKLDQFDEPTILVFWGDHMPILGGNNKVYNEVKYGSKDDDTNTKMFSETPLLMYANFPTDKMNLNSLSPIYFGTTVFDLAGLSKPPFYHLLDEVMAELPVLKSNLQIDSNQKFVTGHLTKSQKQLLSDYSMLQYDLLIGKQYSRDLLFTK